MTLSGVIPMRPAIERRWRLAGALLAAGLSLLVSHVVYHGAYLTADEGSYEFQAHCFLEGRVARPLPPFHPVFEHKMILLDEVLGWLSRYSPGHGLWLAPGAWLGAPRLMAALAAALSVWLLTGCARRLDIRADLVVVLMLASPYFLFMYGTLLSHTSAHAAYTAFLWAGVAWAGTRHRGYAVAAGLSWAFLFLVRNYTALLLAGPLAGTLVVDAVRRRSRAGWAGLAVLAACAAVGPSLQLLHNGLTTGRPLLSPYQVYNPLETLGFGRRYMFGVYGDYTWRQGLSQMLDYLRDLDRWAWGFRGSLAVSAVLLLAGWRRPWSAVLAGSAASVWVGYIFFSSRTRDLTGPSYYFETFPCLVLGAALGVQRMLASPALARPRLRRGVAAAAGLALLGAAAVFAWTEGRELRTLMRGDGRYREALRRAPPRSLIFVDGIYSWLQEPICNPRGLGSDPLVVRHVNEAVTLSVAKCFPDRTPWLMHKGREFDLQPVDRARRLEFDIGPEHASGFTGSLEAPADGPACRAARAGRDGPHWVFCGAYAWLPPGRFRADFDIACKGIPPGAPLVLDAVSESSGAVLAERRVSGARARAPLAIEWASDRSGRVEFRVCYGGAGEVEVYGLRIAEWPGPAP